MSEHVKVLLVSPSGQHVQVECTCGRVHWTGCRQDVMCNDCGTVLSPPARLPANAARARPGDDLRAARLEGVGR